MDYIIAKEGSNLWIDSWFIQRACKNKEGAQEFLNYICSDEPAQLNFEYVYYASPIQSVIVARMQSKNEAIKCSFRYAQNCRKYTEL